MYYRDDDDDLSAVGAWWLGNPDIDWDSMGDEEYLEALNGARTGSSTTTTPTPVEELKWPTDEEGNPLTREDVLEAIGHLEQSMLRIDEDVKIIEDEEIAAEHAKRLKAQYEKLAKQFKDDLRAIDCHEDDRLAEIGARNYVMPTDEGNLVVTEMVEETVDWFEEELAQLKDRLAERVRDNLATLSAQGHHCPAAARDKIYEDLVAEEVIEAWEPLEF